MARKRKGLSKRQRFEVFKRDGFACQYCGRKPPETILEADHIIALANGGPDHESNMITSCSDCNRGKSDVPLEQIPDSLAKQIGDKRDRATQVQAFNEFLMDLREREESTVEQLSSHWCDFIYRKDRGKWQFSPERKASIRVFLRHLTAAEILDAMDIALSRIPSYASSLHSTASVDDSKTFKYFCGICWSKIRERDS